MIFLSSVKMHSLQKRKKKKKKTELLPQIQENIPFSRASISCSILLNTHSTIRSSEYGKTPLTKLCGKFSFCPPFLLSLFFFFSYQPRNRELLLLLILLPMPIPNQIPTELQKPTSAEHFFLVPNGWRDSPENEISRLQQFPKIEKYRIKTAIFHKRQSTPQ